MIVSESERAGYNPDQLFDLTSLAGALCIRNWRAGDRFWPAHSKGPKKVKELLQERHVTAGKATVACDSKRRRHCLAEGLRNCGEVPC